MSSARDVNDMQYISEVPTQFDHPILSLGTQGQDVLKLRKLLNHWNISLLSFSTEFDFLLEAAVKQFQRRMFLPEDGIVGPQTWQALHIGAPLAMPQLQKGSTGNHVQLLQIALNSTGQAIAEISGIFDQATEQAVQNFQRRKGLVVDGVVGCSTWRALSKIPR